MSDRGRHDGDAPDGAARPVPASVLLIGHEPPPIGGVSVHLRRLRARLRAEGHAARVADERAAGPFLLLPWLLLVLLRQRLRPRPLVHVHSGNWRTRAFAAAIARALGLPAIVTVHSFRPLANPRTERLACLCMKSARALVVTNDGIRERCVEHGADPAKILVQHAYLDPAAGEAAPLPEPVERFVAARRPLLLASAFRLRFHEGLDLYGLDLLIDLAKALETRLPEAGLLFLLPEAGLPDYLEQCRVRIRELGLVERVLIWNEPIELVDLLPRCELMIRPTTTDGDSLSIREALFLGRRVLASDAVPRPPQAALFKSRDGADLLEKTLACLQAPPPVPVGGVDGWPALRGLYAEVLDGRR